jgi:hypothetical protein
MKYGKTSILPERFTKLQEKEFKQAISKGGYRGNFDQAWKEYPKKIEATKEFTDGSVTKISKKSAKAKRG